MSADETPRTEEALTGAWNSEDALDRVLKTSRQLERTLAQTQERLTEMREAAKKVDDEWHRVILPYAYEIRLCALGDAIISMSALAATPPSTALNATPPHGTKE